MVACLLLLLILFRLSCAQPGFVSIHSCALSNTTESRNITWMSDNHLLNNIGRCTDISIPNYLADILYRSARVFDTDHRSRWCYNLPVVRGQDYLVRATFLFGPSLRSIPETYFNVSIGYTSISRVDSSVNFLEVEGIFPATKNHTNICLLRGKGNAYISMLELRPLNDAIYLDDNSSNVLSLVTRVDLGNYKILYGYPEDPFDRQWALQEILPASSMLRSTDIFPRANSSIPLGVLQTAQVDEEQFGFLHTDLDRSPDDYLIILYFLELNANVQTGQRIFDIYVNGEKTHEKFDILENGGASNFRRILMRVKSNGYLNISLTKVSKSLRYGPICNAYEIYQVHPRAAETVEGDANAMEELKKELMRDNPDNEIFTSWFGDPCMPYPWEGLACEERNGSFVITILNLSSKSLRGQFPSIISNLTELKELYAENNDFSGYISELFASLQHLSKMSIKCNPQLDSQLPPRLLAQTNLTVESGRCIQESKKTQTSQPTIVVIGSIAGGSVAITVALGLIFSCFYKRTHRSNRRESIIIKNAAFTGTSFHDLPINPVVQSFTLQYIEKATCSYKTLIGEGGFGAVYRGTLPQGQEVAVKVRSATSTQGTREFDNEVNLLSNIRHENLVPLLGYCCENDQQILVYPFMSNGSLQDRLYGEASKRKTLDWPTRLSIALGAARGLMYLHTFARRCIIHRDVKSSNILLDDSMCGKVADFGFSKYAPQEGDSGASLEVRGTAGYLDPEYYSTQQLSTKSDVFSFGVVLLEIITGREPLNIHRPRNEWSLLEWAKPFIRESRIEEIVDPSIKGGYHAEAMWRVVETALACIEPFSTYRPNMVDIVRELEDGLIIENNASEYMRSIESAGGSGRFVSIERKMMMPVPTPNDTSTHQITGVVQPR